MDDNRREGSWGPRFSWVGFMLLSIGILLLLKRLGYLSWDSDLTWPIVLILVGVGLLLSRATRRRWC